MIFLKIISLVENQSKKQSGVVVSVPTRISFVGGGYDFSNYINLKENYILNNSK